MDWSTANLCTVGDKIVNVLRMRTMWRSYSSYSGTVAVAEEVQVALEK